MVGVLEEEVCVSICTFAPAAASVFVLLCEPTCSELVFETKCAISMAAEYLMSHARRLTALTRMSGVTLHSFIGSTTSSGLYWWPREARPLPQDVPEKYKKSQVSPGGCECTSNNLPIDSVMAFIALRKETHTHTHTYCPVGMISCEQTQVGHAPRLKLTALPTQFMSWVLSCDESMLLIEL